MKKLSVPYDFGTSRDFLSEKFVLPQVNLQPQWQQLFSFLFLLASDTKTDLPSEDNIR